MLQHIAQFPDRVLISDAHGEHTGNDLLRAAAAVSASLGQGKGQRIALLAGPGSPYVSGMLGIWQSGAAYVPLCTSHPPAELAHVIRDSEVSCVLVQEELRHLLPGEISIPFLTLVKNSAEPKHFIPGPAGDAMILYTSGTTGKPKGAVHTHRSLEAQVKCLADAWEWTGSDRILHFLPLHHTHGIVNKLLCALYSGARCDMLPAFNAEEVWKRLIETPYTVFMAVPTIYAKLIQSWEEASAEERQRRSEACRKLRLMVSGSAALPVAVLEKWRQVSGHILLERYGMTEIGMALSNPLRGERRAGFVGQALPGVEVRIADEAGKILEGEGSSGELQVRGKNLFDRYYNNEKATRESFTDDGWFKTGDMVSFERGAFRIVGRLSTDIIKTGGYKVSALEIEDVLLRHPAIRECCVLGVADETWGERVAAVVVLRDHKTLSLEELKEFARANLAPYKIPTLLKIVDALPRNAMGKVVKGEARKSISV